MDALLFMIFAAIAVVCAINLVVQTHPISSAISLIGVMGALAALYLLLGGEFIAAAQLVVYAGAIMVLFVFVVMMLNIGEEATSAEADWLRPASWIGPSILALLLAIELGALAFTGGLTRPAGALIGARAVGSALVGPYMLAVEIASFLLLAGLVAALHLGRAVMREE
jgi:NADH-quinone oxidoreductase subunit J